jgi:uncharacterized protein (TIGR03790 family)
MKRATGWGTGTTRLGAWGRLMLAVGTLALGGCRPLGLGGISGWPGLGSQRDDSRTLDARHLALVINSADPLSEAIGGYYQKARHLPADQVIRVRFAPGRTTLPVAEFRRIRRQVERQTPDRVQVYALAWAAPWRVGCQSITSAFSFGYRPEVCFGRCGTARISPYYARGDVRRPWDQLRLRPSMLLAATSVAAGRALIDRGVAADGTRPPGTAYLLSTSDPLRNVRSRSSASVAAALGRKLQVRVLWGDGLRGAPDVIAYFTGLTNVPDIASNHYRPGAVADHLTSYGGILTSSSGTSADGGLGQMSALRWLEAGATGSYGTVVEPCNAPTKFSNPGLLLTYYRRGDTLIESYWRSVAMPDQGVFIGEPLARPWG